jgi:transketolase
MPDSHIDHGKDLSTAELDDRSLALRRLAVTALEGGGRGHIGSTFSLIEIFRVLYDDILSYRPDEPNWPDRDRCILSKGHGCIALFTLLADKGFIPEEELQTFCKFDSRLGGHPEQGKVPGVEFSTGALGHGLPVGVGMALSARMQKRPSRVFVVTGDGEINEGSVWEAAMSAGKHGLSNLTVMVDYNKLQSYGPVDVVQPLEPLADKWRSFGFGVAEVDGHDVEQLRATLNSLPLEPEKPSAIICHTVKGRGIPFAEGKAEWHHKSRLNYEDIAQLYDVLGGR